MLALFFSFGFCLCLIRYALCDVAYSSSVKCCSAARRLSPFLMLCNVHVVSKATRPLRLYTMSQWHKSQNAVPMTLTFRICSANISSPTSVSIHVHFQLFFAFESSKTSPRSTTCLSAILKNWSDVGQPIMHCAHTELSFSEWEFARKSSFFFLTFADFRDFAACYDACKMKLTKWKV